MTNQEHRDYAVSLCQMWKSGFNTLDKLRRAIGVMSASRENVEMCAVLLHAISAEPSEPELGYNPYEAIIVAIDLGIDVSLNKGE